MYPPKYLIDGSDTRYTQKDKRWPPWKMWYLSLLIWASGSMIVSEFKDGNPTLWLLLRSTSTNQPIRIKHEMTQWSAFSCIAAQCIGIKHTCSPMTLYFCVLNCVIAYDSVGVVIVQSTDIKLDVAKFIKSVLYSVFCIKTWWKLLRGVVQNISFLQNVPAVTQMAH